MAEQLLSRTSTYGWLSVLAAMQFSDRTQAGPDELIAYCPLPAAVVDLCARSFVAMSPRAANLLRVSRDRPLPVDLLVLAGKRTVVHALLEMVATEAIDAYAARRRLHPRRGSDIEANVWVVACFPTDRHLALVIITPIGEEAPNHPPLPTEQSWPMDIGGLVVGIFDASWRISRISVDVDRVLGYAADKVVGRSMLDLVYPADAADLFAASARALVDHAGVSVKLHLLHREGDWVSSGVLITLIDAPSVSFAFAVSPNPGTLEGATARTATLERHLWTIAREVEAAGLTSGLQAVPDPTRIPGLDQLSPRQWEILTRLLQNERVPGIAQALHLSQSTVRNYLTEVFAKVGVHSQAQLLALVRKPNLGSVGED